MHPLIELLLKRMESNPDEFTGSDRRWGDILNNIEELAPDAYNVLSKRIGELYMDELHKKVMKRLVGDDPTDPVIIKRRQLEELARVKEAQEELDRYAYNQKNWPAGPSQPSINAAGQQALNEMYEQMVKIKRKEQNASIKALSRKV